MERLKESAERIAREIVMHYQEGLQHPVPDRFQDLIDSIAGSFLAFQQPRYDGCDDELRDKDKKIADLEAKQETYQKMFHEFKENEKLLQAEVKRLQGELKESHEEDKRFAKRHIDLLEEVKRLREQIQEKQK